jgi:hypothetical protein
VARERHLGGRREDAHPDVAIRLRGIDERRLGEVDLSREPLQLRLGDLARVREDSELVALERLVAEHVDDDVAEARHARDCSGVGQTVAHAPPRR